MESVPNVLLYGTLNHFHSFLLPSSHYSGRGKHFFALLLIVIGYPVDSFRFTPLRPLPLPVSEGGHNPGHPMTIKNVQGVIFVGYIHNIVVA